MEYKKIIKSLNEKLATEVAEMKPIRNSYKFIVIFLSIFSIFIQLNECYAQDKYEYNRKYDVVSPEDKEIEKQALKLIDEKISIVSKSIGASTGTGTRTLDVDGYGEDDAKTGRIVDDYDNLNAEYLMALSSVMSLLDESDYNGNSWNWDEISNKEYDKRRKQVLKLLLEKSFDPDGPGIADIREDLITYFQVQLNEMIQKIKSTAKDSDERLDFLEAYSGLASYYQTILYTWEISGSNASALRLKEQILSGFSSFYDVYKAFKTNGDVKLKYLNRFLKKINRMKDIIYNASEQKYEVPTDTGVLDNLLNAQVKEAFDALGILDDVLPEWGRLDKLPVDNDYSNIIDVSDPVTKYAKNWADIIKPFLEKEEYDRAIKILENGLKVNPHDGDAHYYLGVIARDLEQYDVAIDHFERAPKGYFNLNYYVGDCYYELDQYNTAVNWLKRYEKDPDFEKLIAIENPRILARANNLLSQIYYMADIYDRGIEYAKKGIKYDEKYAHNYYMLGHLFFKTEDYQKAYDNYLLAYNINPTKRYAKDLKKAKSKIY